MTKSFIPTINRKLLLACSDPGSANLITSLAYLISDYSYDIFTSRLEFIPKYFTENVQIVPIDEIYKLIEAREYSAIITGTSCEDDFEFNIRKKAIENGVKTFAFVDHWTNIKRRFRRNNINIFPDFLIVNDEFAKTLAINENIDAKLIYPLGNPHWTYITTNKLKVNSQIRSNELELNDRKTILLFLSDNLTETYGSIFQTKKILGYTEFEVVNLLISIIDANSTYELIVKLHPKENLNKYDYLKSKSEKVKIIKNCELRNIIQVSDFVFGMFSSALIEAYLLNKPILRIEPNAKFDLLPIIPFRTLINEMTPIITFINTNNSNLTPCLFTFNYSAFHKLLKQF